MTNSRMAYRGKRGSRDILDLARAAAGVADDIMGQDTTILDLRKLTYITDYFVITTATNPRQIRAIVEAIEDEMDKLDVHLLGRQGEQDSGWVILDYADFVMHVFDVERRKLYDLTLLWGDAPIVSHA